MLDRCADVALASLLLAFSLLFLAWYLILAGFDLARTAAVRLLRGLSPAAPPALDLLKPQLAGEFTFDRAIEAYEHLIDTTYAQGRQ